MIGTLQQRHRLLRERHDRLLRDFHCRYQSANEVRYCPDQTPGCTPRKGAKFYAQAIPRTSLHPSRPD